MKTLIVILAFALVPSTALPLNDEPAKLELMEKVAFLEGKWEGTGWYSRGPGQKNHFKQTEDVRKNLGGLILTIEGKGTAENPESGESTVIHHAFAVVFYDMRSQKFKMHSYKDGDFLDADAEIDADGSFIWGFDLPGGDWKIRFTIRLNEKGQWYEIGEVSRDGELWYQNFEMTLDRVEK